MKLATRYVVAFAAVVASALIAIGAIDYVFTQTLLATHPALNTPR